MNKPIVILSCVATLFLVPPSYSQDLFEFQVYDADLVPKGGWEIDFHLSYRTTEKMMLTPRVWGGCSRHTFGYAI